MGKSRQLGQIIALLSFFFTVLPQEHGEELDLFL
jgi:hypothetical protein